MTQREKEEKLVKNLKDPDTESSAAIASLINKTIKDGHNVYCATDWHLWVRLHKNKPACKQRREFNHIIKNVTETMKDDDLLIYLGDLVDGEFQDKDALKEVLKQIPGKKVLVLGNNDIFGKPFYKSCGFDYVVESFVWNNIIFTHIPIKNSKDYNVHGHLHGYRIYWLPYRNHIDVAACGGRKDLVKLQDVLKKQKSYAKTVRESPEHFEEGYALPSLALFDVVCGGYLPDPFEDDPTDL